MGDDDHLPNPAVVHDEQPPPTNPNPPRFQRSLTEQLRPEAPVIEYVSTHPTHESRVAELLDFALQLRQE